MLAVLKLLVLSPVACYLFLLVDKTRELRFMSLKACTHTSVHVDVRGNEVPVTWQFVFSPQQEIASDLLL
jgi:hypothetical protein